MTNHDRQNRPPRLGILWRGARGGSRPAPDRGLAPLFEALEELRVEIVPVPFADERVEEVRTQLSGLDGVLAWVNPIQDGATRVNVDDVLSEASRRGVFVSAAPAVIMKMGTKEVLYRTRHLGWGCDSDLYRSVDELAERLPRRLAAHRRLVLKQGRGNGGHGVLLATLADATASPGPGTRVRVQEARVKDGSFEELHLAELVDRCATYFAWSGFLVDQEYQPRLPAGMVRCYFSHDEVVGFRRQWPKGLLDANDAARPSPPAVFEGPDAPAYEQLRLLAEQQWVPQMADLLALDRHALPVIWDADFLFGPKDAGGTDRFVLCEINVSAVWPFPPMAAARIATNAAARVSEAATPG